MRTYTVNGTPLDDEDMRWRLEAATRSPTPSGHEIATTKTPHTHGTHLVGKRTRTQATLALSIAVFGQTHTELRENWQQLLLALAGWESDGFLEFGYFDGEVETFNRGVISSELVPEERGERRLILPVTATLPDPFWREREEQVLFPVNRREELWGGLVGGSAPVFPTVHVKGTAPVTGIRFECLTTGKVATWSGSVNELFWTGWQVSTSKGGEPNRQLGFAVEAEPVVYPDSSGEYRLRVEVSGGGPSPVIELIGARSFQ